MFDRILPAQLDGAYRGHRAGLWLFALYVSLKLVMSLNSIVEPRAIAASADAFPLDTYGVAGARAVVLLFAMVGLGQLTLAVLGVLALVRYRAMIPLMYLLLLGEHAGRRGLAWAHAVERSQAMSAGAHVNLALAALLLAGLCLSLRPGQRTGEPR